MRVPQSPHSMRKVMPTGKSDEDSDSGSFVKSHPQQQQKIATPSSNMSKMDALPPLDGGLQASVAAAGFHRSRERTRRSAVLKLLERKQAQKEKEREKRDRSGQRARSDSASRLSTTSLFQSESVFVGGRQRRGSSVTEKAAAASARFSSRNDAADPTAGSGAGTKTYITIGPGKPTRIREHSPSKGWRSSSSREPSPSKRMSSECLLPSTPLKTTELLRDINAKATAPSNDGREEKDGEEEEDSFAAGPKKVFPKYSNDFSTLRQNSFSSPSLGSYSGKESVAAANGGLGTRKRSFTTEKTIIVNGDVDPRVRRMSMDVSTGNGSGSKATTPSSSARSSMDRDIRGGTAGDGAGGGGEGGCFRAKSSFSSSTSSLSSETSDSSECSTSTSCKEDDVLSKRRISLEERFKARTANRVSPSSSSSSSPPPEGDCAGSRGLGSGGDSGGGGSASSRLLFNLSSGYRYHRAAASASTSFQERNRRFSQGQQQNQKHQQQQQQQQHGIPIRKTSMPPTCFEETERRSYDSPCPTTSRSGRPGVRVGSDGGWKEARRRTRSQDVGGARQRMPPGSLAESALEEIRSRRGCPSAANGGGGSKSRMSGNEIDQLLDNIRRSRSQSFTRKPDAPSPPPKPLPTGAPPRLPSEEEEEERFNLPFGADGCNSASSPAAHKNSSKRTRTWRKDRQPSNEKRKKSNDGREHAAGKVSSSSSSSPGEDVKTCDSRFPAALDPEDKSAREAFEMVQKLKDRLSSMSQELDKVKLVADRIRGDIKDIHHDMAEGRRVEEEEAQEEEVAEGVKSGDSPRPPIIECAHITEVDYSDPSSSLPQPTEHVAKFCHPARSRVQKQQADSAAATISNNETVAAASSITSTPFGAYR